MPTPYAGWTNPTSPFVGLAIQNGDPSVALNAEWTEILSEINGALQNPIVQQLALRIAVLTEAIQNSGSTYLQNANYAIMFAQVTIAQNRLVAVLQAIEDANQVLLVPFAGA